MENHHVSFMFQKTLADPNVNIFRGFDRETFQVLRKGIIATVLATDIRCVVAI